MGKEKDDRVVHTEVRENKSFGRDFGFSGSKKAEATLGDGRVGRGDGNSEATAKAAAIRNARNK